jgi:hypothetical protein
VHRIAGYEDVNDAETLAQDPALRLSSSRKIGARGAALTSRLQSLETDVLTQEENLADLAAINRGLFAKAGTIVSPRRVVLDMDWTERPMYGQEENSAGNGRLEPTCYHPLLFFSREGDCLSAKLRPGNVPRRRRLRQAGAEGGAAGAGREVRDSLPSQLRSGAT